MLYFCENYKHSAIQLAKEYNAYLTSYLKTIFFHSFLFCTMNTSRTSLFLRSFLRPSAALGLQALVVLASAVVAHIVPPWLAAQEPYHAYEGNIKGIPIQMRLQMKGAGVIGTYQYVKTGKDLKDLSLEGGLNDKTNLTLLEYDENGKQTGVFKGTFTGTNERIETFAGVWSSPNGKKSFPFTLKRYAATPASVAGEYDRAGKDGASLRVARAAGGSGNEISLAGEAFWVGKNDNIHTGDIEGKCRLDGNTARFKSEIMPCELTLIFYPSAVFVFGDGGDCGGANVTFNGWYRRVVKNAVNTGKSAKGK
jgi:hypothetical protein